VTNMEVSIMERRIGNARQALQDVKSCWGDQYWSNILAYLLRQANRLN